MLDQQRTPPPEGRHAFRVIAEPLYGSERIEWIVVAHTAQDAVDHVSCRLFDQGYCIVAVENAP
jgi:hypothetical protein